MTGPLNSLGHIACTFGDWLGGRKLYEECQAIYEELGNEWGVAMSLSNQGKAAVFHGDHEAARSLQERSLAIMRKQGDQWAVAYSLVNLGMAARAHGDHAVARAHYCEALGMLRKMEGKSLIIECLDGLGVLDEAEGLPERATRLLGAAASLRADLGGGPMEPDHPTYKLYRAHALARQLEDVYPTAWAEGWAMSLGQMTAYAVEEEPRAGPLIPAEEAS
jgi:hypothetical protein